MKPITLVFIFSSFALTHLFAQVPQAIKYQTVVRDFAGNLIQNRQLSFQVSILDSAENGIYREIHHDSTNNFGLITFNIGAGIAQTGVFKDLIWSQGNLKLKMEVDYNQNAIYEPGELMGISELLSVPYALFAERVNNPDKYQDGAGIHIEGTFINNTGDLDSTNELQRLFLSGDTLTISDGNSILLNGHTNYQPLSLSGDTLSLGGNFINLNAYLDNTDNQNLSSVRTGSTVTINISNGTGTSFSIDNPVGLESDIWDTTLVGNCIMIDTTANLGIGTDYPLHKLDVRGDARISALGGVGNRVMIANAAGVMMAVPYDSVSIEWTQSNTNVHLLSDTLKVGIGVSAPIAKLHVKGLDTLNASNAFVITDNNNVPLFKIKNDGSVQIGNYDEPNIRLHNLDSAGVLGDFVTMQNNGNEFFNISMEDGYFGIGDLSGVRAKSYIATGGQPFNMQIFNFDEINKSGSLDIYSNLTRIGNTGGLHNVLTVNDQIGEIEIKTDTVKLIITDKLLINQSQGYTGTFQTLNGDIVTVTHGIITSVEPP